MNINLLTFIENLIDYVDSYNSDTDLIFDILDILKKSRMNKKIGGKEK